MDSIQRTIVSANLKAIIKGGLLDLSEETSVAEKYRKDLQIKTSSVRDGVTTLSGGNQQKVGAGKWLNRDPEVLCWMNRQEVSMSAKLFQRYLTGSYSSSWADEGRAVIVIWSCRNYWGSAIGSIRSVKAELPVL